MSRMTKADAGNALFDVWMNAGDDGLSPADTLRKTKLTDKQFANGKAYLKDVLTIDNREPYSYDPTANVYRMNTSQERVQEYAVYRMKVAVKQLIRLHTGTVVPHAEKSGARSPKRLRRDLARTIEDIIDVLADNGEDVSIYEKALEEVESA